MTGSDPVFRQGMPPRAPRLQQIVPQGNDLFVDIASCNVDVAPRAPAVVGQLCPAFSAVELAAVVLWLLEL